MNLPCRALLTLLLVSLSGFCLAEITPVAQVDRFQYDARMAFIKAGQLSLDLTRSGAAYEVAGEFKTSKTMSAYYTWNGIFAAVGKWEGSGPITTAYMAKTTGKDEALKIVLTSAHGARVLEGPEGTFENVAKPGGIDLISALFFQPTVLSWWQSTRWTRHLPATF